MTNLMTRIAAFGSAKQFHPFKQLATLLLLLCALAVTPLQAQESPPGGPTVATVNINTADAPALAAGGCPQRIGPVRGPADRCRGPGKIRIRGNLLVRFAL